MPTNETTIDDALKLLKKVEDALSEQVIDPCCGWGPLYQEIADFLRHMPSDDPKTTEIEMRAAPGKPAHSIPANARIRSAP